MASAFQFTHVGSWVKFYVLDQTSNAMFSGHKAFAVVWTGS